MLPYAPQRVRQQFGTAQTKPIGCNMYLGISNYKDDKIIDTKVIRHS